MKETDYRKVNDRITEIFSVNEEDGLERKCFRIDKQKKEIICYIEDSNYFVDGIDMDDEPEAPKLNKENMTISDKVVNGKKQPFVADIFEERTSLKKGCLI